MSMVEPKRPAPLVKKRRTVLIPAAAGIILATVFAATSPLDLYVTQRVEAGDLPGELRRFVSFSEVFAHGLGVATILILVFVLCPAARPFSLRLVACAALPGLVVNAIKFCYGRYRPDHFGQGLPEAVGQTWLGWFPAFADKPGVEFAYAVQSFPSGHAATAFGLAVGLSWLWPRGRWLFFLFAALAASQRVVFHAHWITDVLVGSLIGLAVAVWLSAHGAMFGGFDKWEQWWSQKTSAQLSTGPTGQGC